VSEWREMESAPRDGTPILGIFDDNTDRPSVMHVIWWNDDTDYPWASANNAFPECRFCFWMPLPEPPL
jgi:hypothetical protein